MDGIELGFSLGSPDGFELGLRLGRPDGFELGFLLGRSDGLELGLLDGVGVTTGKSGMIISPHQHFFFHRYGKISFLGFRKLINIRQGKKICEDYSQHLFRELDRSFVSH